MTKNKTPHGKMDVEPEPIDYSELAATVHEITGDGGVGWVKQERWPKRERAGFFSDIHPKGWSDDD